MTLKEYFQDKKRGSMVAFAKQAGISKTWLSLMCNGLRKPSPELAGKIEVATKGKVTRKDMRPDIFGKLG